MEILENKTVKEFVTKDFRTDALFLKYGIDFCCNPNSSIKDICKEKKLNQNDLLNQIETIFNTKDNSKIDFNTWPLDLLADYIQRKHHSYVTYKTQILLPLLEQICNVHGEKHPELYKINELFIDFTAEMTPHMKKEDNFLFPYIKNMVNAVIIDELIEQPPFEIIHDLTYLMQTEHASEGDIFKEINTLSNNFTVPADACSTYKVTFDLLKEFQQDMATHIYLENNILFPKAIQLEKEYTSQFN